jgi:hypothetical protein
MRLFQIILVNNLIPTWRPIQVWSENSLIVFTIYSNCLGEAPLGLN